MPATNSTVEATLIINNRHDGISLEHNLALIKRYQLRLTKISACENISQTIELVHPALILSAVDTKKVDSLATLFSIKQAIGKSIPVIFVLGELSEAETLLSIFEQDLPSATMGDFLASGKSALNCSEKNSSFYSHLDTKEDDIIYDYLLRSQITPALLEKSISWVLDRQRDRQKINSIERENQELSSQLQGTKNLFQTIVDNTSTLVWMCDHQGNSTFFNQAWSRILPQVHNVHLSGNWLINVHPLDRQYCQQSFVAALEKQSGFTISYRLITSHVDYRWISNYAVPQFTVEGEFMGLVGYCFDITTHKITEGKLVKRAASDRLLAQITHKIHTSLNLEQILQTTVDEVKQFLLAEKIQIDRVNAANQLTLVFESRLVGYPLSCDITEPKQVPQTLFTRQLDVLTAGQSVTEDSTTSTDADFCSTLLVPIMGKTELWGLICVENCSFARQWHPEEIYLLERVAMVLSVAIEQANLYQQLEQANQELQELSLIDGLTQIANRRQFSRYLETQWSELLRSHSPLSLIMCDIDCFKLYNDTYGHPTGDRCLTAVAQAINKAIKRPGDLACRYGGEEFVIILPRTPIEGAMHLAQQIRLQIKALKIPHLKSAVDMYVTISLGVSCCTPQPNLELQTLIATADKALYQAKAKGRDRAVQYQTELE
ncbi:MAG: diguanylate cyclase [Cyanobacteria bacterium J06623_7]